MRTFGRNVAHGVVRRFRSPTICAMRFMTLKPLANLPGQDAAHGRPNAGSTYGVQGGIRHLKDIPGGAIASIPACPGEAMLADMLRRYAERMTPVAPALHQAKAAR